MASRFKLADYVGGCSIGSGKSERWARPEARTNKTILVVEDEVLIRLMIAEELRSVGYEVIEAGNADQALDVLSHVSGVSLIMSDIRMPGSTDGLGFARLVRSEYPSIPIVLTSGNPPNVASVDHDGYFRKPYHPRQIVDHIKTLLD